MAKEVKQTKNSSVHRFILEPYKGLDSRFTCPSCRKKHSFTRYVDITTGNYFGDDFGRCSREINCGYIKSPTGKDIKNKELFVDSSKVKKEFINLTDRISLIDSKLMLRSLSEYKNNNFIKFLLKYFDSEQVNKVIEKYKIGTSNKWKGATIFWQIDKEWDVRTGKIMLYDEDTGKRVKKPYNHITWVHNPDKDLKEKSITDFNLKQCFFGEHLINDSVKNYSIVESEKTAILCSLLNPKITWLATGGLQNINEERLLPLKDKKLIFYPDKGEAYNKWCDKLEIFMNDYDIKVSDILNKDERLEEGEDLADLGLIKLNYKKPDYWKDIKPEDCVRKRF